MSGRTAEEYLATLQNAIELIQDERARDSLLPALYTPDTRITPLLEELSAFAAKATSTQAERQRAGIVLEKITYLAFRGLAGHDVIKSYRSVGPQIDLLVNGSTGIWRLICETIRIDVQKRGVLVEAKARKQPVGDKDFARLCAMLTSAETSCGLGVFFSIRGATGFRTGERAALRYARLRQVLYYARSRVPIVVLDLAELQKLSAPGALVRLLEQKVRDIEELAIAMPEAAVCVEVELPEHLQTLHLARTEAS